MVELYSFYLTIERKDRGRVAAADIRDALNRGGYVTRRISPYPYNSREECLSESIKGARTSADIYRWLKRGEEQVLRDVLEHGPTTYKDISQRTGMRPPNICTAMKVLRRHDLVKYVGGKPPIFTSEKLRKLFGVNPEYEQILRN